MNTISRTLRFSTLLFLALAMSLSGPAQTTRRVVSPARDDAGDITIWQKLIQSAGKDADGSGARWERGRASVINSGVTGTKTVSAPSTAPGSLVTYTVILTNNSSFTQQDNPGPEFTDVLPQGLNLFDERATSGLIGDDGNRTINWNGSIPSNSTVTITIRATIDYGVPLNTTISNQGTINYDSDGNGTNETTVMTNSCSFVVCPSSLVVTTNADSGAGSLRQAVLDACPNATITFDTAQVTSPITLTSGEIAIDKNLTIQGPTNKSLTISGNNNSRVFKISSNYSVAISYLTITGGHAFSGGGFLNAGDLVVSNSTLTGNSAAGGKGGAIDSEDGTLHIFNSTVSGNTADTDGGGLLNGGSSIAIFTNVTLTNNRADADGNSTGAGGGIAQTSSSNLTLNNTLVAGNFAGASPGTTASDIFVNVAAGSFLDPGSSNNLIGVDDGLSSDIANGISGNQIGTATL